MDISFAIAFVAGLASFLSPCFLPVVPVFIAQLVGTEGNAVTRKNALLNTVAFILGFSLIFILLWALLELMGIALATYAKLLRIGGGTLLIVLGLFVAGIIQLPFLSQPIRPQLNAPDTAKSGVGKSALIGIIFAAGWTPCIGPILGGILGLATQTDTAWQGIMLMLVYCLGLGTPLLLITMGAVDIHRHFSWFKQHHRAIALFSGALLILIGILMITNLLGKFSNLIPSLL